MRANKTRRDWWDKNEDTTGLWKRGNDDAPYCQTTAQLHSQTPPSVVITNSYLIK